MSEPAGKVTKYLKFLLAYSDEECFDNPRKDSSVSLYRRFIQKFRDTVDSERQRANNNIPVLKNTYIEVEMIRTLLGIVMTTRVRVRCSDVYVVAVGHKGRMWELTKGRRPLLFNDTKCIGYGADYGDLFMSSGTDYQVVGFDELNHAVFSINSTNRAGMDVGDITESWRPHIGLFALMLSESARFHPIMDRFMDTMFISQKKSLLLMHVPWVSKSTTNWRTISSKARNLPVGAEVIFVDPFNDDMNVILDNILAGNDNARAKGFIAIFHILHIPV